MTGVVKYSKCLSNKLKFLENSGFLLCEILYGEICSIEDLCDILVDIQYQKYYNTVEMMFFSMVKTGRKSIQY